MDNCKSTIENRKLKWARQDSNLGPRDYESPALTAELQARRAATREHRIFNVQRPIFTARTGWCESAANRLISYLDGRQRCGPLLNEGVELVEIDRFYQVMVETCLAALADILFHSETSESNSERRFRDELLDQIYSTPIG